MSSKVTMKIEAEVTIVIDDGVELDDLELQLYNDNDLAEVHDFQLTNTEVIDSK